LVLRFQALGRYLERAIDALGRGRRQEEERGTLDEFAICLVELFPHSIAYKSISNSATFVAVLQFTHSIMLEVHREPPVTLKMIALIQVSNGLNNLDRIDQQP
jgi:hypothetical protein